MNEKNSVTIAFAPDNQTQLLERVSLADFSTPVTAKMVIEKLAWQKKYPEILSYEIGVFSQKITWNNILQAGNRLEIYRPLTISPMRKRQLIMAQRQKMLNKQRAKNNIAKKLIDKKAYYNALRAEKEKIQSP